MSGVIDFNDPAKSACKITGLMPLHVAVANSLTSMVNFLIDLPGLTLEYDDMRARPKIVSQYGMKTNLSMLLPLQVAAKLGDKKLVQYILRTQSKPEWVWGPSPRTTSTSSASTRSATRPTTSWRSSRGSTRSRRRRRCCWTILWAGCSTNSSWRSSSRSGGRGSSTG